jgi:steroid Delta-isomerase
VSTDVVAVLDAHVRRFNDAVRSGEFSEMVGGFAQDAEMVFEGVPVGPFVGRDAIAEAYARQPPSDEIRLLGGRRVEAGSVECDYAWAAEGRRAGRMIVTARDGLIERLVVTFE